MINKLVLLFITCFIVSFSSAQINVSLDRNCLSINSALLAQSLIKAIGADNVKELIENEVSFLSVSDVDSLGRICKFDKLLSQKGSLPEDAMNKLELYLIKRETRFFICYDKLPGINDNDAYKIITEDLFARNEKSLIINVSFPGDLMILYEYEKEKAEKRNRKLSKYVYLRRQIKKYLSQ
ncbi:MAG: hypothetical protein H6Q15_2416 [Bacteroidetes bacterium]|nr:hypothetical protein [Bacteroidota bacterium]